MLFGASAFAALRNGKVRCLTWPSAMRAALVRSPALLLLWLRVVDVEVLHPSHEPGRAIGDVDSRLQPFPEEVH